MAKGAQRLSDIQEREWTMAIGTAVVGAMVLIAGALALGFVQYFVPENLLLTSRIAAAIAVLCGGGILGAALHRSSQVRKVSRVPYTCPYCDTVNLLIAPPKEDFDCENCRRTVHFQDGQPVPVSTIVCPVCKTEHRIAVNLRHYICDRCNRDLPLSPDPRYKTAAVVRVRAEEMRDEMMQNYDVLLLGTDRRRETELAFKLQDVLVTNLPEARRLMQSASQGAPLIVAMDQPQRKAESLRRQLQELGANVTIRPTEAVPRAPQQARPR